MRSANRSPVPKSISRQFGRFIVLLVLSLTGFRLFVAFFTPFEQPIPDNLLLLLSLVPVAYMWVMETRDRHRLIQLHSKLNTAYDALQTSQINTITALVNSVEARDPYTRGHSVRVQKMAVALARKLELDEDRVLCVDRSAVLHDVGKLGISDTILNKKAPLTSEEWEILKHHPETTYEILSPLTFLARERDIALYHHERHDGKGYVGRLKGQEIPLESAIIAIADSFDAMNSDRPYRNRLPEEAILDELEKSRQTQHPAHIVDAFTRLLKEQQEFWNREDSCETPQETPREVMAETHTTAGDGK